MTATSFTPSSGFSFENAHRNAMIAEQLSASSSATLPTFRKTGTTIVGLVYQDGVVLGADTRATSDTEIAEKNCEKIHYIAPNMYCCGAGTAADCDKTVSLISSQLELLRMDMYGATGSVRVVTACTKFKRMLFRYQGHISAALILGGVDLDGPHVYQIYPHGSTSSLPYTSMGSGSLAAMAMLETGYQDGMNEADAVKLCERAIHAGIFNDLGSGSKCDICILRMDGTMDMRRNIDPTLNSVEPLRQAIHKSSRLILAPGVTPVLSTSFTPHPVSTAPPTRHAAAGEDVVEMET
jgi:20S proteasome subunit beta 2